MSSHCALCRGMPPLSRGQPPFRGKVYLESERVNERMIDALHAQRSS